MSEDQLKVLKAFKLLLDPKLADSILFVEDMRQNIPIKITISGKIHPGEADSFSKKLRSAVDDYVKPDLNLTKRIHDDMVRPNHKRSKTRSQAAAVRVATGVDLEFIDSDFSDIDEYKEKPVSKLKPSELVRLLENLYFVWKNLPGELRIPRKITKVAIRGYLKQREVYSHDDLVSGIKTYGKWAEAKHLAVKNGDLDSFWFYRWAFDKFLVSDKSMAHVDGGWFELCLSQNIPDEYRKKSSQIDPKVFESNVEYYAKDYVQWGNFSVDAKNTFNTMPGLKEAVIKRAEEIKNAK